MRGMRIAATLGALALAASAGPQCGGKDEPEASVTTVAADAAPTKPPAPVHPQDEEALVTALADALEGRDLEAIKRLTAPELGADLHRMHAQDAAAFWGRGQKWITNVRAGFSVAVKQEGREDRWRALLEFEGGEEETVIFTKVGGKLVFAEL